LFKQICEDFSINIDLPNRTKSNKSNLSKETFKYNKIQDSEKFIPKLPLKYSKEISMRPLNLENSLKSNKSKMTIERKVNSVNNLLYTDYISQNSNDNNENK
jgi:hypothetical protein